MIRKHSTEWKRLDLLQRCTFVRAQVWSERIDERTDDAEVRIVGRNSLFPLTDRRMGTVKLKLPCPIGSVRRQTTNFFSYGACAL